MNPDPDWIDEDEFEEPVKSSDVAQLINLRHERDRKKEDFDRAEREYRAAEALLWEKMDANNDTSIKKSLPGLGTPRITKRSTIYARVADLDTLLDSLEQEGRVDELTKPAIEKKRLNELVRECLEAGIPIPEGADFYEKRYIQITENA